VKWRKTIKHRWSDECALTGIRNPALLRAVHIIHEFTGEKERGRANGIALAPHIHELFDKGLIAFKAKGCVLLSAQLSPEDRSRLGLPTKLRRHPTAREKQLLSDHRRSVFLGT
jgi:predicted restriction endonuclease